MDMQVLVNLFLFPTLTKFGFLKLSEKVKVIKVLFGLHDLSLTDMLALTQIRQGLLLSIIKKKTNGMNQMRILLILPMLFLLQKTWNGTKEKIKILVSPTLMLLLILVVLVFVKFVYGHFSMMLQAEWINIGNMLKVISNMMTLTDTLLIVCLYG